MWIQCAFKVLLAAALICIAPIKIQAQIVGQGAAGTDPWPVSITPASAITIGSTLSTPGAELILPLAGRTGAGTTLSLAGFSGQMNAYVSFNGGTTYAATHWGELLGNPIIARVSVLETAVVHLWIYVPSGATTVRLYMAARTAGSITATLAASNAPSDPLAMMTGRESQTGTIESSIQIGGAANPGGEWHAATVIGSAPGDAAAGLVVRNRSGLASIQTGPSTSNDGLANVLSIRDLTSGNTMEPAQRTDAVLIGDRGIVVRPVPSATLPQLVTASSLPLPTGAATEASLLTVLTSTVFQARINTLGQKTMATSTPVVLPSDQTVAISAAALPLPAGASTGANQTTEISSLASLLTELQLKADLSERQPVGLAGNTAGSGTITALNGTVTLATAGLAGVGVQVTGVWTQTLALQGTIDGSNWVTILPYIPATRLFVTTAGFTANGIYTANIAPYAQVRLTATAFTSGTAVVTFAGSVFSVTPSAPTSTNVTVTNGTGSSAANVAVDSIGPGSNVIGQVGIDQTTPGTSNKVSLGSDVIATSAKTALTVNAPAAASVGVASAQALASNAGRKGAVFVNTSNATISCAVGATAVLNSGITLQAGGVWSMNEYTFATGAVNCIASAAASNLAIQEFQ